MKLQQLQIFQNLTEEELEKSLVCSQAVPIFSVRVMCR